MCSKDRGQLAYCLIPLFWIRGGHFISPPTPLFDAGTSVPYPGFVFGPFPMPGIHTEHAWYFLRKGALAALLLCCTHCGWMCSIRSSIDHQQCFFFSLPKCWTYCQLVLLKHSWLIRYLSKLSISVSFFSSRPVNGKVPDRRIWSAHTLSPNYMYVWFQSAISKDFFLFDAKAVVGAWLSVQIICSFTSFFWGGCSSVLFTSFIVPLAGVSPSLVSYFFLLCLLFALGVIDLAFAVSGSGIVIPGLAFTILIRLPLSLCQLSPS